MQVVPHKRHPISQPSLPRDAKEAIKLNTLISVMQSQIGVQSVMPHLHFDLDAFQKYYELCVGSTGRLYTTTLKGIASDVERNTSDSGKQKCSPNLSASSATDFGGKQTSSSSFRNTHSSCYSVGNTQPKDTEAVNLVFVHTEDPNHTGPSVSSQHKRKHQNSQTLSSIDEARASKRAHRPTATCRSMSVGRANRRTPTVAHAIIEGCSSGHKILTGLQSRPTENDARYGLVDRTIRVAFAATVGWAPFVDASLMLGQTTRFAAMADVSGLQTTYAKSSKSKASETDPWLNEGRKGSRFRYIYSLVIVENWDSSVLIPMLAKIVNMIIGSWHPGRASDQSFEPNAGKPPVSSAEKPCSPLVESTGEVLIEFVPPRRLDSDEIPLVANDFRIAAKNAMEAGFDGVEIHVALGYLIEQFLKDEVNDRTDKSRGSLETVADFLLRLAKKWEELWSTIAAKLPGRRDNEIKNRWNRHFKNRAHESQDVPETRHVGTVGTNQANLMKNLSLELQETNGAKGKGRSELKYLRVYPDNKLSSISIRNFKELKMKNSKKQSCKGS
ncbi:putative 12-oxophytodienoate reductase 11 [Tanacetum coccineum]